MVNPTAFFRNYCSIVKCMHGELFVCLFVLSVYVCQNNEQNHLTVDTLLMWYLAPVKNKPVILRHLVDMWFINLGLRPRWINHISPRCLKITLTDPFNLWPSLSTELNFLSHTCTRCGPIFVKNSQNRDVYIWNFCVYVFFYASFRC